MREGSLRIIFTMAGFQSLFSQIRTGFRLVLFLLFVDYGLISSPVFCKIAQGDLRIADG